MASPLVPCWLWRAGAGRTARCGPRPRRHASCELVTTVSTRRADARCRLSVEKEGRFVDALRGHGVARAADTTTIEVRVTGAALAPLAKRDWPWLSAPRGAPTLVRVRREPVEVVSLVAQAFGDLVEILSEWRLTSTNGVGLRVVQVRDLASWRLLVRRAASPEASTALDVVLVVVQLVEVLHAPGTALRFSAPSPP